MIPHLLALCGILYYGYKKLKEIDTQDKSTLPGDTKNAPEIAMSERLNRLFEDIQQNSRANGESLTNTKTSFQRETETDIAVSASALGMTTAASLSTKLAFLGPLAVPLILYASRNTHRMTFRLLKKGKISLSTLITLTLTGVLLRGQFLVASSIIFLIGLAFYFTSRIVYNSRNEFINVFDQYPNKVWVCIDATEVLVDFAALQAGDIVVVHAGEVIPADGCIVEGMATVDQHLLTGEAQPIEKEIGDDVFALSLLLSGQIKVRVDKAGDDTTIAKIKGILKETIEYKSTVQLRADSFSKELVKPVFFASALALPLLGTHGALAVMNTHPKNKTMLLSPICIINFLKIASRQGILIKDGRSLELLSKVDTLVFDKTGTLTEELPHVGDIHCCAGVDSETVLRYAAAAEYRQTHPLAKAILHETKRRSIETPVLADSEYRVGYGLIVHIDGRRVHVGSERFMRHENITVPATIEAQQQHAQEEGYTLVMVAVDGALIGAIELLPTLRPEIKAVITNLKQHHNIKHTYIISGDNAAPTRKLAEELGIDQYFAPVLPQDKAARIQELQARGHFVCYVGDGINDTIALKTANVSVSLRGASTIATDTAQIVLMDQGLAHLDKLFVVAKQYNHNMNTTFAILLAPAVIGMAGAFLLNFGIVQTVMLNMTGLGLGLGNVMSPLLQNKACDNTKACATPHSQDQK